MPAWRFSPFSGGAGASQPRCPDLESNQGHEDSQSIQALIRSAAKIGKSAYGHGLLYFARRREPTIGTTIGLLKVIAYNETQVLEVLHDPKLPMRETRIDRLARPLEQWNVRPTIAERHELSEAQRAHRLEVEAAIDQELRMLRSQRLAEAGI